MCYGYLEIHRKNKGRVQRTPRRRYTIEREMNVKSNNSLSNNDDSLDSLELEIQKAMDEKRFQRHAPRSQLLSRSSSVNMYRRRLMPSFDSDRRLHSPSVNRDFGKDSWDTLDSIHSRVSTATGNGEKSCLSKANDSRSTSSQLSDLEDSTSSFASFGGMDEQEMSLDAVYRDNTTSSDSIALASKSFTTLQDEVNPDFRCVKQLSLRMKRGPSFRGSLSLIQEHSLDARTSD